MRQLLKIIQTPLSVRRPAIVNIRVFMVSVALCGNSSPLTAQDDAVMPEPPTDVIHSASDGEYSKRQAPAAEDDENVIRAPKEPPTPPPREFTAAETRKVCARYKGHLLSVFGEIFKIENCTRHPIHDQETLFMFARQGVTTIEVDPKDVAAIPIGDRWENISTKTRHCSTLNRRYVTFSYTDIYYVENCVRKLIPDYETLLVHRRDRGFKSSEVLALTAREFYQIRQGRDVTSVIDKEFAKLMEGSAGVDIIPIDEACRGLEGRFVTFYSRMYKIEKCRKREINAEKFTMKRKINESNLIELRPEQWVSMPDGKPFESPSQDRGTGQ